MIPQTEWRWFGHPGHFICAFDCRFHLCTLIGDVLVSTVGEYFPDAPVREILAESRGIQLAGKGNDRKSQFLREVGYEDIGLDRKYETMSFRVSGEFCVDENCGCGMPVIIPSSLEMDGYNDAGSATKGHYATCERWASSSEGRKEA